jgi:hypothetical protein
MTPKKFFNQDLLFTQMREENVKLKLDNANLRETVHTLSDLVASYHNKIAIIEKNKEEAAKIFASAIELVKKIEAKAEQKEGSSQQIDLKQ